MALFVFYFCIIFAFSFFLIIFFSNLFLSIACSRRKKKKKEIDSKSYNEISLQIDNKRNFRKCIGNYITGYINYSLHRLSRFPSQRYRKFILKNVFKMEIGDNVVIYGGFEIREPWNITIGEGTIIGHEAKLDGRNGICIGKNVNLSTGVWIWTEQHDHEDELFRCLNKGGAVIIDDRAWLSCRSIVLPRVHIGEGAVLAAGAIATKNLDSFGIYAGCPAKKISERNKKLKYVFNGNYRPFY